MRPRPIGPIAGMPIVGMLVAGIGAWSFLTWSDRLASWIPKGLVSGSYNTILLLEGACFAVLLHRFLRRGRPATASGRRELSLGSDDVVRPLAIVGAALVWVNAFDYLLKRAVEYEYRRVMPLFALEMEGNLPTLYSTVLLLTGALLAALVWKLEPSGARARPGWLGLASLLTFLALDEFAELHERLVPLGKQLLAGGALFGREWIVAYGIVAVPVGLLAAWFVRQLPRKTRRCWILAAGVFLAGAVGLELLAGWHAPTSADLSLVGATLNIGKESLEMAGMLIFLHGMLELIELRIGRLGILPKRP